MRFYLLFIFFLSCGFCICQNSVDILIDSLNLVDTSEKKIALSQKIALNLKDTDWERALTYLDLAETEAKKTKNPETQLAPVYITAANIYDSKDVYDVALDYYQKAFNIYKDRGIMDEAVKTENNLAIIYAKVKDTENALGHFKNVYKYQAKQGEPIRLAQILNNIGTLYLEKDADSSLSYYQKSLAISKTIQDTTLYAYVFTNLGRAYALKNDKLQADYNFGKAVLLTKSPIANSLKTFIFVTVSEHFLKEKQNDSAIYYANKALDLNKENVYSFINLDVLNTLYKANLNQKAYKNAAEYFEQFNAVRDSLNIEDKVANVERLKLLQDYKTRNEIRGLNDEKQRFKYFLIGLSLISGILILLIILIKYRNRIIKNRLENEILKSKQQELRQSLDFKNKVLIGKAMTEMHRTDIINGILKDLKHVKLKAVKKETQEAIDYILKRLQRDLNTDIWQEFEVSFEQVHKSFFKKLNENHKDLTPKDRRLCALLFLDLTSKEISQITGQSFKAVENARTRLRKKLDLTNEKVNLSTYLNTLS